MAGINTLIQRLERIASKAPAVVITVEPLELPASHVHATVDDDDDESPPSAAAAIRDRGALA